MTFLRNNVLKLDSILLGFLGTFLVSFANCYANYFAHTLHLPHSSKWAYNRKIFV